jgi:hypothetical protein
MWATSKAVHVQQVPGMRFNTYNDLFSIVKGPEETLPISASHVEEAMARVVELCPKQITEVSQHQPRQLCSDHLHVHRW